MNFKLLNFPEVSQIAEIFLGIAFAKENLFAIFFVSQISIKVSWSTIGHKGRVNIGRDYAYIREIW